MGEKSEKQMLSAVADWATVHYLTAEYLPLLLRFTDYANKSIILRFYKHLSSNIHASKVFLDLCHLHLKIM